MRGLRLPAETDEKERRKTERAVANYIEDTFKGFGPKQSRNLLQMLGLTRYEIPIDSRLITWLNPCLSPVALTSPLLGDRAFYEFVEVVAYVDDEELGWATVRVTTLGAEFVQDVSGECSVEDFPSPGETVTLEWQQSHQNFVITEVE